MINEDGKNGKSREREKSSKSIPGFKRFFVRLLLFVYILCVLGFSYWYWMRPVRSEQFTEARKAWGGYAEAFNIPVPEDERYGW
jgi:hypothetical protein